MQKNDLFDICKGFLCIFVIFLHCRIRNDLIILSQLFRIAVPFFIMISGFFSYKTDKSIIKKRLGKLFKFTMITILVYFIWNCVYYPLIEMNYFEVLKSIFLNCKHILTILIFNRGTFICSIMYYFLMMIYVYLIFLKFDNFFYKSNFYLIIFTLLIIGLIMQYFDIQWYYVGNWLFTGLPFFGLGVYVAKCKDKIIKYSYNKIILCIVLGIIFSALNVVLIKKYVYYDFGNILLVVSLFCLCVKKSNNKKLHIFNYIGRYLSTYIFMIHLLLVNIFELIFSNNIISNAFAYLSSVFCSICLSFILSKMKWGIKCEKK